MPSFSAFTAAAALLAVGAAAPAISLEAMPAGAFSVGQVLKGVPGVIKAGPKVLAEPYIKYNKPMPSMVQHAAAASTGTVVASPEQYDSAYLCPVQIGTPPQTLNLDFDTGSSDLWVYSSEQPASQQSGHSVYNPGRSSTSRPLSGYTWSITYGDGSNARGNVYTDVVAVGKTSFIPQAVELAQSVSASFLSDVDNDGLLGLAFDSLNTVSPVQQKTFFSNVKASLPLPVFTVNLKKGAPGNYNFGYIDSSEYTGSITYVNVNTGNGFWEFTGNGYAVGTGGFVSSSIDAIADTGTTLLYLPAAAVKAYYAKVSGATNSANAGGYIFPCSATLPSITLGIGSYRAVVPGSYINYAPYSGSSCFGGIQSNAGIGFSIYGDIFLKSQFVVFNGASTPQLGFAAKPT